MMKIAIDIDDTITNTKELQLIFWKEYIKKYPNKKYNEELPENINHFGDEYIDHFWDEYRIPLAYSITVKKDAKEVINKLREEKHKIIIVTSRSDRKYINHRKNLLNWFKSNNIQIDELYTGIRNKGIFIKEKNIDILIDDDYNHCKETISLGKKAIMFNNKNNKIKNINNWNKIYEYIQNINKKK